MQACLDSVRSWADRQGFDYRFEGDALFDRVPARLRSKLRRRPAMMSDLARLLWCREALQDGATWVVWLDADTLIFAPHRLNLNAVADAVFGQEYWLQEAQGERRRVYRNVHNAFCMFHQDSPTLPFLAAVSARLLSSADLDRVPEQFVGPKLLTALHNTVGFDLDARFGAVSPLLARRLLTGKAPELPEAGRAPMHAANLCASLASEIDHDVLVEYLLERGEPL